MNAQISHTPALRATPLKRGTQSTISLLEIPLLRGVPAGRGVFSA